MRRRKPRHFIALLDGFSCSEIRSPDISHSDLGHLKRFLRRDLENYSKGRKDPLSSSVSHMSMYLHFGQISPVYIALQALKAGKPGSGEADAFIDELIVQRELAANFVNFNELYDSFDAIPSWARETLHEHADQKKYHYTRAQLESAKTHDKYWNAAMLEMKHTGYLHNYMRMYWGKMILEWTATPKKAWKVCCALNNKYFIDGRDMNSWGNCAWVFGVHDHPWPPQPVFGKVRSMTESGLRRKTDPQAYVEKVAELTQTKE